MRARDDDDPVDRGAAERVQDVVDEQGLFRPAEAGRCAGRQDDSGDQGTTP
jgi:hypothetical protein